MRHLGALVPVVFVPVALAVGLTVWLLARAPDATTPPAPAAAGRDENPIGTSPSLLEGTGPAPSARAPVSEPDLVPFGEAPSGGFGVVAVVTSGEEPAAGVLVRLRPESPEPWAFASLEAWTDASGIARIGPVPVPRVPRRWAGKARFVVELPEGPLIETMDGLTIVMEPRIGPAELAGVLGEHSGIAIDEASTSDVRWFRVALARPEGIPVVGRVVTSSGAGIPGVAIRRGDVDPVLTEPDGAFRLPVSEAGRVEFAVSLFTWGDDKPRMQVTVDVPPGGVAGLTWVLEGVGEVHGRATEADGRPAAGAEVCLTKTGQSVESAVFSQMVSSWSPSPDRVLRARVAEDGTFRFVGTVPGVTYDVVWWAGDEEERVGAAGVGSGATDVEIRLERHGLLPRLVDARDGRPVHGELRARVGEIEVPAFRWFRGPMQEGILAPPGSRVTLHGRARGYVDAVVEHVVDKTLGLDPVPIRMTTRAECARVRLRCLDDRGAVLPWPATAWIHQGSGLRLVPSESERSDGFTTTDLGAGEYRVRTQGDPGYGPPGAPVGLPTSGALRFVPESDTRVVVPERGEVEVPWVLPTGGALRLAFHGPDGAMREPGDMRSVRARDGAGREIGVRLYHQQNDAWQEGTGVAAPYESQALPAGTYEVVWYDRGEGGSVLASSRVFVTAGGLTPVDLTSGE